MTNQINNQSIIPSTDVTQLTLTLKMTTAQVVETSVTVNNNSPIQDYVHPDDQTQPFDMTPGFKPFTIIILIIIIIIFFINSKDKNYVSYVTKLSLLNQSDFKLKLHCNNYRAKLYLNNNKKSKSY